MHIDSGLDTWHPDLFQRFDPDLSKDLAEFDDDVNSDPEDEKDDVSHGN